MAKNAEELAEQRALVVEMERHLRAAREYARGPVPVDVCLKRTPSQSLVDALIARSVQVSVSEDGTEELRDLARDDQRPLIHRPLATRYVGAHPEAGSDRTVVRFVVSSGEEARDDKDLQIQGIDFTGYDLNPVWLFAHDWEGLPIGRCLARRTYQRGNTYELWKDIEFTPRDLNPFGYQVGQMHVRGFLRACSGGWMGTRIRIIRGADGKPERVVYLNSDWMETSSCAVGIDKFAVQEAALRGIISSDDVDQFARAARIVAASPAYEVRMATPDAKVERAAAFQPNAKRTLVDEHIMENVITEWPAGEHPPATRSAGDGTVDATTPAAEQEQEGTAPQGEAQAGDAPQGDAPAADGQAGEAGASQATEPQGEAASADDDPTAVRAAIALLRRAAERGGMSVEVRGPVSQAVDSAVDSLYANVMVLAQCVEELRCCASNVFWEGRSADEAKRVVRARMDAIVERMNAMMDSPEAMTDAYLERGVARAEAALARSSNALSELRDAVALFAGDEEGSPVTRAGRKISRERRGKITAALAAAMSAIEALQSVLDEEPDPDEEGEDTEGEAEGTSSEKVASEDEADAAVRAATSAATRALVERAARTLGERVDAPLAARTAALGERFAALAERMPAPPARAPEPAPAQEPENVEARASAVVQRAKHLPGVRLPQHARRTTS